MQAKAANTIGKYTNPPIAAVYISTNRPINLPPPKSGTFCPYCTCAPSSINTSRHHSNGVTGVEINHALFAVTRMQAFFSFTHIKQETLNSISAARNGTEATFHGESTEKPGGAGVARHHQQRSARNIYHRGKQVECKKQPQTGAPAFDIAFEHGFAVQAGIIESDAEKRVFQHVNQHNQVGKLPTVIGARQNGSNNVRAAHAR